LELESAGSPMEQVRYWERELNRLHAPCGCEQGAGGLLIGIVGYLLYLWLRPGGWGNPGSHELWIGCGVVIITTSLGKAAGILMARRKLRRLIQQIRAEGKLQRPPEHNYPDSGPVRTNQPSRCCGG